MASHFGWKAAVGILFANLVYALVSRWEFAEHRDRTGADYGSGLGASAVPTWVTGVHLAAPRYRPSTPVS